MEDGKPQCDIVIYNKKHIFGFHPIPDIEPLGIS